MRTALVAAVCFCAGRHGAAAAGVDTRERLADFGATKVVLYADTISSNGRYAIGWTIRAADDSAKPVDWSLLEVGQDGNFLARYDYSGRNGRGYHFTNCVVDLEKKRTLPLTGEGVADTWLRFPPVACWARWRDGRWAGFVEAYGLHATLNFWLVTADASGLKQRDLFPELAAKALKVARKKRPLYEESFTDDSLGFPIVDEKKTYVVIHGGMAEIPFETEKEDFWAEDRFDVKGTVTVRLADGAVIKAGSKMPRDEPAYHERYKLADVGGTKVVLFTKTLSPDGRYALGWTVLPLDGKKTSRVDWSEWDAHDCWSLDDYHIRDKEHPAAPYESVDCMVDLKAGKILRLPTATPASGFYQDGFVDAEYGAYDYWGDPGFTGYESGYLTAAWGPPAGGRRYALVENDGYEDPCPKFPHGWYKVRTHNLWLVTIDQSGMTQREVTAALDKASALLLADKRPSDSNLFGVTYPVHPGHVTPMGAIFHGGIASIPIHAESDAEPAKSQEISGTAIFRLADAKVEATRSDATRVDIMMARPDLAAADRELHDVYTSLVRALDPAGVAALKEEQAEWMAARSNGAYEAEWTASGGGGEYPNNNDKARDQSLLESTQKRAAELNARLAGTRK